MPKKPAPKTATKPELVYEIEGAPPKLFVIYSRAGSAWVTADGGWTMTLLGAGTFSEARAAELAADGHLVQPLGEAARDAATTSNPVVLQALAAIGGR